MPICRTARPERRRARQRPRSQSRIAASLRLERPVARMHRLVGRRARTRHPAPAQGRPAHRAMAGSSSVGVISVDRRGGSTRPPRRPAHRRRRRTESASSASATVPASARASLRAADRQVGIGDRARPLRRLPAGVRAACGRAWLAVDDQSGLIAARLVERRDRLRDPSWQAGRATGHPGPLGSRSAGEAQWRPASAWAALTSITTVTGGRSGGGMSTSAACGRSGVATTLAPRSGSRQAARAADRLRGGILGRRQGGCRGKGHGRRLGHSRAGPGSAAAVPLIVAAQSGGSSGIDDCGIAASSAKAGPGSGMGEHSQ